MGDSWIVDNLNAALNTWNGKLAEIWQLLTESPQTFRGGQVWSVMVGIHGALQAIGYGLLVLFFAIGVVKTCGSFVEVKRPEHALKLFIRFALAKAAVTYGLELMQAVFSIVQGTVSTVITQSGTSGIRGVSRDRKQIRTAASTVQAERTAQQKAQQFAQRTQQAAKNASKQTRKAVKAVRAAIRHFLAALRTLTAAIVAGMSAATAIIVIICLVAFIAGSAYGIFFAAEAPDENSITVQQAVEQLTGEYRDELEHISDTVPHDRQEIETNDGVYYIRWQDVLAVFSSRVSGAEDGAPVAALDETRLDELREILWDMNEVSYTTREETVEVPAQNANTEASRDTASESTANDSGAESQESNEADTTTITQTVLTIHLTHKTPEEMQTAYNFTARQAEYLTLLQDPKYETLWAELLGGFAAGDSEILTPDTTRTPTGSLQWPLPIPGSITSPFGYRTDPLTGETSYHDGTDIAVPESTPILADADGTVTVANALDSWGGSYGYYVQIDHSSGLQTLYAHCSQICVTQGQQVQAGQVIAYVGHTGRATGNHLHFEVRENGERVDAMSYYQ